MLNRIGALSAAFFAACLAAAQPVVGTPTKGVRPVYETVAEIMARQPGYDIGQQPAMHENEPTPRTKGVNPAAPRSNSWPINTGGILPAYSIPQSLGVSFHAADASESPWTPPDVQMAAGSTQLMVHVNGRIKVFSKTGTLGPLNVSQDNFFQSVRGADPVVDPRVRFDRLSQRWYLIGITTTSQNNRVTVAVSDGPVITSQSSFAFYFFNPTTDGGDGTNDLNKFCDYPTLGIDEDALYIGANMFNGPFNTSAFIVRKSSITSGGPIVMTAFRRLTNRDGNNNGIDTPQGVDCDIPGTNVGYVLGTNDAAFGVLTMRPFSDPGGTPVMGSAINVTVPTNTFPGSVAVLGSTQPLDGLDDRLMHATMHKDKVSGRITMTASHAYRTTNSGVANSGGDRNGTRWYEIDMTSGTPSLRQSGSLYDNAASPSSSYWMSGIAMSGQGHIFVGATHAGSSLQAGIGGAGRASSSALGTLSDPLQIVNSSSNYNRQTNGTQRWGDYSFGQVDPNDDMTIWCANEYCSATNTWGVRIYQMIAPPVGTITSLTPNSALQGATLNLTAATTSSNGSGFFDPGTGYANRLTASVSGTGVTVNSVTFVSPSQCTINVTVAPGAATGARTVTVTNPDGQTATATLSIAASTNNPAPTLTSISPTTVYTLRGSLPLTVNGSNFVASSSVRINGTPVSTSFVSSNQLAATVPASNFNAQAILLVTVFNPAPGGGTSTSRTLTVGPTVVSGTIDLQNWTGSVSGRQATVEIFNGAVLVDSRTVTLTASGGFSYLMNLAPGSYSVFAKSSHWLRKLVSPAAYASTGTFAVGTLSLINGDCDHNNEVGLADFGVLSTAFGTFVGDPGYNAEADLDGDGEVGLSDFGILSAGFGMLGD